MPTYAEMLTLFSVTSKGAIFKIVQKWVHQGLIKIEAHTLVPLMPFFSIPLLGTIKAGIPAYAESQMLETIAINGQLIGTPGKTYALRVSGDSMIEAGIMPGDIAILDNGKSIKNGDIVAAEVDGEWTLKYFKKSGHSVELIPANKSYKPIRPKQSLTTAGVMIKLIREY